MPVCPSLQMSQLIVAPEELTLVLAVSRSEACCPLCGRLTSRIHSRYLRTLQDLPWGPLQVQLRVQVHRFVCQNPDCKRRIFTQPLPELADRYARRTNRLREAFLTLGWALGGEAGARQCVAHAMPLSGATLLSLLRRCGATARPTPRALGVDDWSDHSHSGGTLLVDLERHQPVEVLSGTDEQVLADWLLSHPGVEVISRDRGASSLKGANKGAPQARTVARSLAKARKIWGKCFKRSWRNPVAALRQAAQETLSTHASSDPPRELPPPLPAPRPRKSPTQSPRRAQAGRPSISRYTSKLQREKRMQRLPES